MTPARSSGGKRVFRRGQARNNSVHSSGRRVYKCAHPPGRREIPVQAWQRYPPSWRMPMKILSAMTCAVLLGGIVYVGRTVQAQQVSERFNGTSLGSGRGVDAAACARLSSLALSNASGHFGASGFRGAVRATGGLERGVRRSAGILPRGHDHHSLARLRHQGGSLAATRRLERQVSASRERRLGRLDPIRARWRTHCGADTPPRPPIPGTWEEARASRSAIPRS